MSLNYFKVLEKEELLNLFMSNMVLDIIVEKGINQNGLTEEEAKTLGDSITQEWSDGKTQEEMNDILFEKFGSSEEKADYANWKLSI